MQNYDDEKKKCAIETHFSVFALYEGKYCTNQNRYENETSIGLLK